MRMVELVEGDVVGEVDGDGVPGVSVKQEDENFTWCTKLFSGDVHNSNHFFGDINLISICPVGAKH